MYTSVKPNISFILKLKTTTHNQYFQHSYLLYVSDASITYNDLTGKNTFKLTNIIKNTDNLYVCI